MIVLSFVTQYLGGIFDFLNKIVELSGIDNSFYQIILKITAIGYLTEFGAEMVNDLGFKGLSDKLVFVGKILILSISLPVFYAVFNLLTGLI